MGTPLSSAADTATQRRRCGPRFPRVSRSSHPDLASPHQGTPRQRPTIRDHSPSDCRRIVCGSIQVPKLISNPVVLSTDPGILYFLLTSVLSKPSAIIHGCF